MIKNIRVPSHVWNVGKGAEIRRGIHLATGEIYIIQEAGLGLSPNEYPLVMK